MNKFSLIILVLFGSSISLYAQSLEDYFKIGAENNPGLNAKYKAFEAAMQRVTQAGSLPDPNLSFGYFISPVETRVGAQRARFSLTQMFPWFGTLKVQENVATLLAEAKYQEFLDARNKLYYQISAAYYTIIELNEMIIIEENNIAILSSYKDIATVQFQNGKGAMVDVLRVDIMLNDATSNLAILNKKELPLRARFNNLLNRNINDTIMLMDSLNIQTEVIYANKESLLKDNPMLEELDLKIKASLASEKSATKQGLPKLGIGMDYVIVEKRSDMSVPDNGKDAFMPMISLSLPIYRSKYKAAVKEAQLMQESYSLQRQDVSNRLSTSYEMVWFDIIKQVELIDLYTQQIKESEQSLNLLFSAYSNAGKDFEEVLRMQQQILKYKKLKVTALVDYQIAIAELDYITAKAK